MSLPILHKLDFDRTTHNILGYQALALPIPSTGKKNRKSKKTIEKERGND
jgi:hypothetical protein